MVWGSICTQSQKNNIQRVNWLNRKYNYVQLISWKRSLQCTLIQWHYLSIPESTGNLGNHFQEIPGTLILSFLEVGMNSHSQREFNLDPKYRTISNIRNLEEYYKISNITFFLEIFSLPSLSSFAGCTHISNKNLELQNGDIIL